MLHDFLGPLERMRLRLPRGHGVDPFEAELLELVLENVDDIEIVVGCQQRLESVLRKSSAAAQARGMPCIHSSSL